MEDFPAPNEFLADARRSFPQFYAMATVQDKRLLDSLVMVNAALVVGMNTPRDGLDNSTRAALERQCTEVEQAFTKFREAVRACPTFQRVSAAERLALEQVAIRVRVPEE